MKPSSSLAICGAALLLACATSPALAQSGAPSLDQRGGLQLQLTTNSVKIRPGAVPKGSGRSAEVGTSKKNKLVVSVALHNRSSVNQVLAFSSREAAARKFSFSLVDAVGKEVRLEPDLARMQTAPVEEKLGRGRRWSRTAALNLTDAEGRPLVAGNYTLVAAFESEQVGISSTLPIEILDPVENQPGSGTTMLLPENFTVWVGNDIVATCPWPGAQSRTLPTVNHYVGADGGYVALYTRNPELAVYSVGGGIYVAGQLRIKGRYVGRIFWPEGYEVGSNITQDPEILALCARYFPKAAGQVWVGGDTGGFLGL
jgi:hypothetical protein